MTRHCEIGAGSEDWLVQAARQRVSELRSDAARIRLDARAAAAIKRDAT